MRSSKRHAIAADFVFDGANLHRDQAVLVGGARVAGIVPRGRVPAGTDVHTLPGGAWLAPGFIDVQVNGGGDVLFNNQPDADAIATIVAAHRKSGTTSLLPTFITDTRDKMKAAVDAVRKASDHPGVLGIHLEGPFLSPEKPGVHRRDFIRQPDAEDFKLLTSLGRGVTLVTLAPEVQPKGFIAQLAKSGIRVSLGHSAATYEQTKDAIAQGLTGFTHLFNAMPPLSGREPGPVGAALESPDVFFGVIVDGLHVDPAMLRIALSGRAHPMLVTDAMAPVGGTRSSFELYGEPIEVVNGRCTRKDGALAGSAIDMATAIRNCVDLLQIPLERALSLASANPAAFLGRSDLGHIAPGRRADLVALEPRKVQVLETWVAGMRSDAHAMA
jgi:N-acetylglucosamine-6-phosphate deacetylase